MASNTKKHSNRSHKRYYPLSQEDTLELLLLLNQVFIASDANIVRKMATATRGACPPPLRRPSRSVCEVLNTMAPLNVCNRNAVNANRRYSTLVTVSERVVLRSDFSPVGLQLREKMLQSVSAHLMDERRGSTRQDRRRSTYGHSADSPAHHSHHNFLMPPQPVSWVGTQIIQDFQPTNVQPNENPIGWAIFNPLPIRAPIPRPRLRQIQITTANVPSKVLEPMDSGRKCSADDHNGLTVGHQKSTSERAERTCRTISGST
ncbi:hypothetical protein CAEBREN_22201 [Caenorhabditis brenneri]|uniref:Uncharacterized protein n=1 Tax=Caenorhabditis brenneri TaxID=135651 RepID=G0MHV6_CAEBE|nr:hypothetical protein CAEBREN_22201 [Caenorhabditis brenneri]